MPSMTIRTTVAFAPATAQRLERLSKHWKISKSETLRRALEVAESAEKNVFAPSGVVPDFTCMQPLDIVLWLREHPSPPVPGGWGENPHLEMRNLREMDANLESDREN